MKPALGIKVWKLLVLLLSGKKKKGLREDNYCEFGILLRLWFELYTLNHFARFLLFLNISADFQRTLSLINDTGVSFIIKECLINFMFHFRS